MPAPDPNAPLTVAVVITCFNEAAYIGAAVRSVLEQTRSDLIERIVIADDGSDDETLAVLRDIEGWDPRITVIYGPGGVGLPGQRNRAVAETSAPAIAFLDGDDFWVATKIERQVPLLAKDPGAGLVYSGFYTFATDIHAALSAKVLDITDRENLVETYFLNDPPIIPSTIMVRRSFFDAIGGFDTTIKVFEDTDFYLRLARQCRFLFADAPLIYKRSHLASITGGRKDLMAHHALVAFKAASEDPNLLRLVPKRLSERARKLGNQRLLAGEMAAARGMARLAVRLDPFNAKAWLSLAAVHAFPGLTRGVAHRRDRRRALFRNEPATPAGPS